jgi:20S proteasome alpha/beta subunit
MVYTAAHLYHRIIYNNKNTLLSSIIVTGWDSKYGAQIYAVSSGGSLIPCENFYGTGSGMAIMRGYLEANYRLVNSSRLLTRHLTVDQERRSIRRQYQTDQDLQGRAN